MGLNLNQTYKIIGKEWHTKKDGTGDYGLIFTATEVPQGKGKGLYWHEINRVYIKGTNALEYYNLKVGMTVLPKYATDNNGKAYIKELTVVKPDTTKGGSFKS